MHTGIGRGVVDKHLSVLIGYPSVGKSHIHHVAQILITLRHEEVATGTGNHLRRIVESRHIHI